MVGGGSGRVGGEEELWLGLGGDGVVGCVGLVCLVEDACVCDWGCGCGRVSTGSALVSWMYVGALEMETRAPLGRRKAMSVICWISSAFLRNMAWSSLGEAVSVSNHRPCLQTSAKGKALLALVIRFPEYAYTLD